MSLTLSLNILKALGGDTSIQYDTVDDVWVAINEIYGRAGDGIDIEAIILNITENGQYDFDPTDEIDAYAPVHLTVNIPQKYTDEQVESLTNTARQEGYQEGFVNGESEGEINQKAKLTDIKITDNGVYETENGYKKVTVAVEQGILDDELQQMLQEAMDEGYQDGYAEGLDEGFEDGVIDQKGKLEDATFTANGTYTREDGWDNVTVAIEIPDIPTFETETLSVNLTDNGTYNYTPTTDGYSSVSVNVKVESTGTGKPKVYNGFRFTSGYPLQVDFSQYDWSDVYDLSYMFAGCRTDNADNWTNFQNNFNGRILSLNSAFAWDISGAVGKLPPFTNETANCYDMYAMCYSNNTLTSVDVLQNWDIHNVRNMKQMFYACSNITSVTLGDTSNVRNMESMFYNCKKLTSVTLGDTGNVRNMVSMFEGCNALTSIPQMDTSNVTNMKYAFKSCYQITSFPELNTSKVHNMYGMFENCKMTTIPQMDVSKVIAADKMFCDCQSLTEIPDMNFKLLQTFGSSYSDWLYGARNIVKIGVIDCDSIYNANYALGSADIPSLTDIGGFRNLGMQSNLTYTNSNNFIKRAPNLTRQSLLNVFNLLYDRATAGYSVLTITMHANHLALLSDDDIAIATNKGWIIA